MADYQQGMSAKDMMMQMAFARMNQDGTEEAVGKVFVARIAGDVAVDIADADGKVKLRTVDTLVKLNELKYDKDSDVAKSLIATSNEISKTLVKIANAVGNQVS